MHLRRPWLRPPVFSRPGRRRRWAHGLRLGSAALGLLATPGWAASSPAPAGGETVCAKAGADGADTPEGGRARDERRVREVLRGVLADLPPYTVAPAQGGYSGLRAFRVQQGDDAYFLKVVLDWKDVHSPAAFAAECETAPWAASNGLGPEVVAASAERGLLLTRYLANEQASYGEAGEEPRLSATLRTMATLHRLAPAPAGRELDLDGLRHRLDARLARLEQGPMRGDGADARLGRVRALHASFVQRLVGRHYRPTLCHGDLQPGNALVVAGRAWFVDWGSLHTGDPMRELAKHVYHVDANLAHLSARVAGYGELSAADLRRCQLHLAIIHAEQFVDAAIGMPWDRPARRDEKLARLFDWLVQDAAYLEGEDADALAAP